MRITFNDSCVFVSGVTELTVVNFEAFCQQIQQALGTDRQNVDFDLASTSFIDSSGLGALVRLRRSISGDFKLIHPQPCILKLLEFSRLHAFFTVVN